MKEERMEHNFQLKEPHFFTCYLLRSANAQHNKQMETIYYHVILRQTWMFLLSSETMRLRVLPSIKNSVAKQSREPKSLANKLN